MVLKRFAGKIHLWLGLATGLVVFIVALTGAIYCFAPELQTLTQKYRSVNEQSDQFLPPSQIKKIAEEQLPGKSIARIFYGSKNKAVMVLFSKKNEYSYSVFINPYSGKVLKVTNNDKEFFSVVLKTHRTLLIPYGHEIIRWSTLIFLIMLISGMILWWPKNRRKARQGFSVKWKASPKRLNYDLHKVLGFYSTWILIFIVLTGLIWTFDSFANFTYRLIGSDRSIVQKKPPVSDGILNVHDTIAPIDCIWKNVEKDLYSKYATALFVLPAREKDPILLRANPEEGTFYKTDFRYFNQYTGKEIVGAYVWGNYKDALTIADNIKRMNYDIHTGAVFGLVSRIAVFFAALIAASLPITGFYFWWGRNKKNTKRKKPETKSRLRFKRETEFANTCKI